MDGEQFDTLIRVFAAQRSRRDALRGGLAVALFGVSTRDASAGQQDSHSRSHKRVCIPENYQRQTGLRYLSCPGGFCSCGEKRECCNNRCFWDSSTTPTREFCCAGPTWVMCGGGDDAKCCENIGPRTCTVCEQQSSGIAGTIRRPR